MNNIACFSPDISVVPLKYIPRETTDNSQAQNINAFFILSDEADNEKIAFIEKNMEKATQYFNELNFLNESILDNIKEILAYLFDKGVLDIIVSKTGDEEILLSRSTKEYFNNLIFDEYCNIEHLFINNIDRRNTYGQVFHQSKGFDFEKIANLLKK